MTIHLTNADAARIPLRDQSVHTCVTSPPYWGLRRYSGVDGTVWPSVTYTPMAEMGSVTIPGDTGCEHVWGSNLPEHHPGQVNQSKWKDNDAVAAGQTAGAGSYCQRCGAWRGMLGLEPTPEMYVAHLVLIFREVWRVMRDDGVLWLNLGDSYSGSNKGHGRKPYGGAKQRTNTGSIGLPVQDWDDTGLKPKDLCGIPWRVAFALQADGWYLRSDIVWAKGLSFCDSYAGSCMPESVTDRCTKAHEYVFMLAKNKRYFWDQEAVKEASIDLSGSRARYKAGGFGGNKNESLLAMDQVHTRVIGERKFDGKRNLRDVWAINPGSYPGSHYAVFPPDLVEPCIKAGTSEHGVCPECGAPWERVVKPSEKYAQHLKGSWHSHEDDLGLGQRKDGPGRRMSADYRTLGWQPTCDHDVGPVPATVLDLFAGSGTTGEVARRLGRDCVLLDLSHKYLVEQATKRLELDKLKAWSEGNGREQANLEDLPMFGER